MLEYLRKGMSTIFKTKLAKESSSRSQERHLKNDKEKFLESGKRDQNVKTDKEVEEIKKSDWHSFYRNRIRGTRNKIASWILFEIEEDYSYLIEFTEEYEKESVERSKHLKSNKQRKSNK